MVAEDGAVVAALVRELGIAAADFGRAGLLVRGSVLALILVSSLPLASTEWGSQDPAHSRDRGPKTANGRGGPFARGLSLYLRQPYHRKTYLPLG